MATTRKQEPDRGGSDDRHPRQSLHGKQTTAAVSTLDSNGDDTLDHTLLPTATLLLHPDGRRLGEQAALHELHTGMPVALARTYPAFSASSAGPGLPLDDPHVSRSPLWIRREGTDLVFSVEHAGVRAIVAVALSSDPDCLAPPDAADTRRTSDVAE